MNTQEITHQAEIDEARGCNIITRAINFFNLFIEHSKKQSLRKLHFMRVFDISLVKHLLDKYPGYSDFAPFYLNLDDGQ